MSHHRDNVRSFTLICMFILFIQVKNSFTIPATLTTTNTNSNSSNNNSNDSSSNNSSSSNISNNSSNDSSNYQSNGDNGNGVHEAVSSGSNNSSIYGKCMGPGDRGPCKSLWYKYRYDAALNQCVQFIWGGCEGNSLNRFDTIIECNYECIGAPHTIPPNMQTTTREPTTTESPPPPKSDVPAIEEKPSGSKFPIPFELRGSELTFAETGEEKTFVFAKNNTFIQMDGEVIQRFQLRLCREISFQFRTRLPHGLLVYHNVKNPEGIDLDPYALYVIVEKGQLKVVHVFGKHSTSVTVGEALNRDEWHSVMIRIDVHGARLIARVDNSQEEVYLKGLNHDTNYGVSANLTSVVLVGGLSSEEKLHGVKYIIESFVGCIRNVTLSSGKSASDLLPISPLVATKHENVKEGCDNRCHSRQNLCFVGSRCINHYNDISCDCFGLKYEGEHCDIYTATILTLRGSNYVSYRIYDWKDRVHSTTTRISIMFRTYYEDSALFYASGESNNKQQYIGASIKNQSVYVEMDFGDFVTTTTLSDELTRSYWHNLTISHENKTVKVILDRQMRIIELNHTINTNLLFDPEIYFGGGPDLNKKKGLASHNNFVGNLKYVYYNDISILYELKKGNPKVHYHGVLEAEFEENEVHVIPITYPFATSHIWWPIDQAKEFNIKFDFRSTRTNAVLAYTDVITKVGNGFWEIRQTADKISFDLVPDVTSNTTITMVIKINRGTSWHSVELDYRNSIIKFVVDYRDTMTQTYGLTFDIGDKVIIGSSLKSPSMGLVGCIRDIEINGHLIEPRHVVKSERVVGEVALDNCKYIDPCKRPNTCEHGGKCIVRDDQVTCDCRSNGYIGKNCHFTKHRKTCEELALLGYTKSDVYLIDIDGNGVFPPAHVKCDFVNLENATKTIVEHNLPSQVDVRSSKDGDFSYNIKYREFSPEMLQELISHSLYCTQHIKYDCYKAPLELHSATWFTSSDKNRTVDFLGNVKRGACPCSVDKTCADPNQSCNCDVMENKWYTDEGSYSEPHSLGITNMYFIQQKDLDDEAQGRITLGPLECVETNTQKYVVTFTTSQSYIEVPGWRKGDIAFSFRTTGEKAILLFQPPIRPYYPSFIVTLTGDFQLTFNFTLSTGTTRELVINSNRKLNGGEWHKIWIDYNEYHVRFMINTDYQIMDLLPEEKFGPFEGSMYIGGATAELSKKLSVKQGLIGCFRGLVVNGEILDIYSYMSVHLSEIIKECKPSCVPSPCKNGAECRELWSTFQCICSNAWAHLGEFCETNINEKALTFINRESYLKRNYLGTNSSTSDERDILKGILSKDILINLRTYDTHSLVLYANDHFNNFVHLFITNGKEVVFLYNYGDEIVNLTIVDEDVSSLKSIQVAINRHESQTIMHVNNKNVTSDKGTRLLEEYSNKPWTNPEMEVLSPHRPPAPPTEYFQFNVGGYDTMNLLRTNPDYPELEGYIGCVRGLKIGDDLIDLAEINEKNIAHVIEGVLPSCQILCDAEPCKNGGICKENFAKQESTCDCEHTSFLGEFCIEEKGADFSGESNLQRKFELSGKVDYVKLQLAFSSNDLRRASRIMLLVQTVSQPSYYLMVGLTPDGFLFIEEDRGAASFETRIDRYFLNEARHSIYYLRNDTDAILLIDGEKTDLVPMFNTRALAAGFERGSNKVQIGGINTTDPRFALYKSYSGCLSNIYIQVNNYIMKPLEEYMLFTKTGADNITVINSQGVRSAQCNSHFDIDGISGIAKTNANESIETSQTAWNEDAPVKIPYVAEIIWPPTIDTTNSQAVFITLTALFVIIVICCFLEVYRSHLEYKKRIERETDEDIIRSKEQATKLHESPGVGPKTFNYKPLPQDEKKENGGVGNSTPLVGILKNGSASSLSNANQQTAQTKLTESASNGTIPKEIKEEEEEGPNDDKELKWEPLSEQSTEESALLNEPPSVADASIATAPVQNGACNCSNTNNDGVNTSVSEQVENNPVTNNNISSSSGSGSRVRVARQVSWGPTIKEEDGSDDKESNKKEESPKTKDKQKKDNKEKPIRRTQSQTQRKVVQVPKRKGRLTFKIGGDDTSNSSGSSSSSINDSGECEPKSKSTTRNSMKAGSGTSPNANTNNKNLTNGNQKLQQQQIPRQQRQRNNAVSSISATNTTNKSSTAASNKDSRQNNQSSINSNHPSS